jgi:hypothetical protein
MALILGIDRFMSECRAITSFIGNAVTAVVVAKSSGELDYDKFIKVINNDISDIDDDKNSNNNNNTQEKASLNSFTTDLNVPLKLTDSIKRDIRNFSHLKEPAF